MTGNRIEPHGEGFALTGDEDREVCVVETERRLSTSTLWQLQRSYFERSGIQAWSTTTVPHYITNNPALARAYAEVVLGFLRDCRAATPPGAPGEPVTILEIGAGSGRFAYLFLVALADLHRRSSVSDLRFRYVMTDFTESNVAFWRAHEAFAPFVAQGVLDFAVFDADETRGPRNPDGQAPLWPGGLPGPLVVIANYVFDGLPQDAFSFEGGQIHERLVALTATERPADLADPALLGRLSMAYHRRPAPADCYGEPALDAILRGYASTQQGKTVLFPCGAIRCVQRLAELGGGRLLLLSGDRGAIHEDAVGHEGEPQIAFHGSFSLPVNYHAIGEYVRGRGGRVLRTEHRQPHLTIAAFLLAERAHPETHLAFTQAVERGGPDAFVSVWWNVRNSGVRLPLEAVLSLIRLSSDDPRVLRDCLPWLQSGLAEAEAATRAELGRTILRVWANYFSIGEERDFPFELAVLLHALGRDEDALDLFRASVRHHGDDPRTQWNMGLCLYRLRRPDEAALRFREAARLDPEFSPSQTLELKEKSP